jgi:hypothetical protein
MDDEWFIEPEQQLSDRQKFGNRIFFGGLMATVVSFLVGDQVQDACFDLVTGACDYPFWAIVLTVTGAVTTLVGLAIGALGANGYLARIAGRARCNGRPSPH